MKEAYATWDAVDESLEVVEARIHDGVPREQLRSRGRRYIDRLFNLFPGLSIPDAATVVEVGPGVGYIMEALAERAPQLTRVIGLDVAPGMIAQGQARLRRDGLSSDRFQFQLYDGIRFPFQDDSIEAFYSVAAIQHIPKPLAYNIFREIVRCLKPGGWAAIHLMHWDCLPGMEQLVPFSDEIQNQVMGKDTHWHHYYDEIELTAVLRMLTPKFIVVKDGHEIWAAWAKPSAQPGYAQLDAVKAAEEQAATAEDRATAAEYRATAAEERARAAEVRATAAEERAKAAEVRATATEERATAAEKQLEAIRLSTSWRLTEPLRRVIDFLRT